MVSWDLRKSAKLQPEPRKPVTTIRQWAGACRVQFGPLHGLASPRKMQGIYREKVLSPSLTYQRSLVSVSDPETGYSTSLNYLNCLFLVPHWFWWWFSMTWQWPPHVRGGPHSPFNCGTYPWHAGAAATSSKTTIKTNEGLKIDGLDSSGT
jgi:hypothetical protein